MTKTVAIIQARFGSTRLPGKVLKPLGNIQGRQGIVLDHAIRRCRAVPSVDAVVIATVDRNGPAFRSGVRQGDVVLAINGDRVESSRGLIRAVAAVPPGRDLRLTVRRQGRELEIPVTVGRRPQDSAG